MHNIHKGKNIHVNENFPDNTILLGEALKGAGYRTAYIGKWDSGLEKNPLDYGYEIYDHNPYGQEKKRAVRFENQVLIPGETDDKGAVISAETDEDPRDTGPFRVARKTAEVIEQWAAQDKSEPFYMFSSTVAPHVPWLCPKPYAQLYNPQDIPEPDNYHDELGNKPLSYQRQYTMNNYCRPGLAWPDMARALSHYYGVISLVDDAFGHIMESLRTHGFEENTLVLFTSDHGEFMGRHGLVGKTSALLEDIVRVPLVCSWPQKIQPKTNDCFVNLTDAFATLTALAGANVPVPSVSRDMRPLLFNTETDAFPDAVFFEHHGTNCLATVRGIRTRALKYVFRPLESDELYDLRSDPLETKNLIADSSYAESLKDLKKRLYQWMADTNDTATRSAANIFRREGVNLDQ